MSNDTIRCTPPTGDTGKHQTTREANAKERSTTAEEIKETAQEAVRVTNPIDKEPRIEPGAVPVAPGLEDAAAKANATIGFRAPREYAAVDRRTIGICAGGHGLLEGRAT